MDTWTHKFVDTKRYQGSDYGPNATITVEAGLHKLDGNERAYFSVTASIVTPASKRRNDIEAGGCLHADIVKHWPKLAPIVALHLSDDTGAAMHLEANGWYWLAGYYGGAGERFHGGNGDRQHWNADGSFNGYRSSTPDECLGTFAEHIRIPVEQARELADTWRQQRNNRWIGREEYKPVRVAFRQWLTEQEERYREDVRKAIELLDSLGARPISQ